MRPIANLQDKVYGRLSVTEYSHTKAYVTSKQMVRYWKCICTCGAFVIANGNSLRTGAVKSCGCLRKEQATKNRPVPRNNKGLSKTPEYKLWAAAKERATRFSQDFNIEVRDVVIPDKCPVLGVPLARGKNKQTGNSPSLDRVDSSKGYVKGNVAVISHRANSLKQDASIAVLEAMLSYMKRYNN